MAKKADTGAKRVFIGIPAGKELQEKAKEFRKEHLDLPVRWIKPENLHLTVVPPWQCASVEPVCTMLDAVASGIPHIEILFTSVSLGTDRRNPRLIWATGSTPDVFSGLQQEYITRLQLEQEEKRAFLLHLTIARIRSENQGIMAEKKFEKAVTWPAVLRTICLYESVLKPSGAEYRVLCEAPFGRNISKC